LCNRPRRTVAQQAVIPPPRQGNHPARVDFMRRAVFGIVAATLAVVAVTAAQPAPSLPPPPGFSPYDVLDLGPAPTVGCTCVSHPFTAPSLRSGRQRSSGLAVPLEPLPMSDADRQRNRKWDEEEERNGVRQEMEEALAGNGNASFAVGLHLSSHRDIFGADETVEADVVRWLTLGAEQGHVDAMRLLAFRYAHGLGTPQNYPLAAYWFDRAARHDDALSMVAIGFLHAAGRGIAQDWTTAIRWWQRAGGAPLARQYLGDAYACGLGVDQNAERAKRLYGQALEASAAVQLGRLYLSGCVDPDDKAAFTALRQAADDGSPEAQIELSGLFRDGRGVEPSIYDAYFWARLAERRLPSGPLKTLAGQRAAAAARLTSAFEVGEADKMIDALIRNQ
jgi:TPR repeat protein